MKVGIFRRTTLVATLIAAATLALPSYSEKVLFLAPCEATTVLTLSLTKAGSGPSMETACAAADAAMTIALLPPMCGRCPLPFGNRCAQTSVTNSGTYGQIAFSINGVWTCIDTFDGTQSITCGDCPDLH